ncbi:RNA polymerase sigma factor [Candidatus Laterigemmans baculatus]|uniref:RNA polymerase sigma factor n=1 Tax=Candidatus Laterigemmans baculatus TaxID=2770505 RepID=UPI0013DC6C04|nr:RNA polymerase sigma factor [Candidatus Laterigemmans baculatus]
MASLITADRLAAAVNQPGLLHGLLRVLDPQTLSRLWRQHVDRLLIVARAVGEGVGASAEDAVQEAFLQLARQPQTPDDPLAWLVRVTRNQLLQWHRSGSRRTARERSIARDPQAAAWLESGTPGLDDSLDAALVTAELQQLPEQVREVIVMHLWGELTFQQIADITGGSRSSIHRLYQQGLTRLRCRFESFVEPDSPGNLP